VPQIFKVGGCVRDKFLGVDSKDIDFTFVLDELDETVEQGFQIMTEWMTERGFEIFLSTPDCFTIRARFPKDHQFNGMVADLKLGILRTPLPAEQTMMDDPLRILRALRFQITKGFSIHEDIWMAMAQPEILEKLKTTVSAERIRDEVFKMMKQDTPMTIKVLSLVDNHSIPGFIDLVFGRGLWLKPTFEL